MNKQLKTDILKIIGSNEGLTVAEIRKKLNLGRLELRREVMSCITKLAYERKIRWVLNTHEFRYYTMGEHAK